MRMLTLLAVMLLTPAILPAQSLIRNFGTDIKYGALDMFAIFAAPFHGSARDYEIAAASLGVVGLSSFADQDVATWVSQHPNAGVLTALKPFREASGLRLVNVGNGSWNTNVSLAVYGVGLFTRNRAVSDVGMGCLAAATATSVLRQGVFDAVTRERPLFRETIAGVEVDRPGRPYDLRTPGQTNWYAHSFFAGHATTVTSCVSFINHRFHLGYAEPVLWAFAAGISLGRIADQRHYTSDVMLGGLVGYAVGKLGAERALKRIDDRRNDKANNAPANGADQTHSWMDGLYVSRAGNATLLGWRTPR